MKGTVLAPVSIPVAPWKELPAIEYFELKKEMFTAEPDAANPEAGTIDPVFTVTVIPDVELSPSEYLQVGSGKNLEALKLFTSDTTVLNFQVGTGKSTLLIDLIKQYASHPSGEYVVVYCAPFLRLIGEIQEKVNKAAVSYAVLTDLNDTKLDTTAALNASVQLMTPAFLLGSGGKRFVRQRSDKREYQNELLKTLRAQKRKVIFVMDEIHESTDKYDSMRLPHLLRWHDLVHKVYVASATFTREAVEVTKVVSYLTDRRISIFQGPRVKRTTLANLHVHVCKNTGGAAAYEHLPGVERVVRETHDAGRVVHVLTAHQTTAEKLTEPDSPVPTLREIKATLLTSKKRGSFNPKNPAVGTAFTTGVNIEDPSTLILVFPFVAEFGAEQPYGIFTNPYTSVAQAVARLREGGDVHIFLPPFSSYIKTGDISRDGLAAKLLSETKASGAGILPKARKTEPELWVEFKQFAYGPRQEHDMLIDAIHKTDASAAEAYRSGIGFPSLYDFTLAEYSEFANLKLHKERQGLIPYVLWLALMEQFANCTLVEVLIEEFQPEAEELPREKLHEHLLKLLTDAGFTVDPSDAENPHRVLESILTFLDQRGGGSDAEVMYTLGASTKPLSIRKWLDQNKIVGQAMLRCTLQFSAAPWTSTRNTVELIRHASMGGSIHEKAFVDAKTALVQVLNRIYDEAVVKASKVYIRHAFDLHLTTAAVASSMTGLTYALERLAKHPWYKTKVLHLPKNSKGKPNYHAAAQELVRQALDLVRKRADIKSTSPYGDGESCSAVEESVFASWR